MKSYFSIEEALKDGFNFHSFRSGGGLRVLRLDKKDDEKGYYGEAPNYINALRILIDDLSAGGRKYKDVYGKIETHYLTGAYPDQNDAVDCLLYQGHNVDATFKNEAIVVTISKLIHLRTPKEVCNIVTTENKNVRWKRPNSSEIFISTPYRFANDEIGTSTQCENNEKHESMPRLSMMGIDQSFNLAIQKAINDGIEKEKEMTKFILL